MKSYIRIAEIEQSFKDIFEEEDGLVQSVETTYEISNNEDFYKLVISLHGLSIENSYLKQIWKKEILLIIHLFIYMI